MADTIEKMMQSNPRSQWSDRVLQNVEAVRNLGLFGYLDYKFKAIGATKKDIEFAASRHSKYRLKCRPDTSDQPVFNQIFVKREYQCLDDVVSADFIIDCGANVGYSSAYFSSRYMQATVVAVEPDQQNFATLKWNLEPFGDRVKAINAAVWSHECGLTIDEQTLGEGLEWARKVRECKPDEIAQLAAVEIGAILEASRYDRISILKMDIEGAEGIIFSKGFEHWIERVDNIVIEIHGDTNEQIFRNAINGLPFKISKHGELTVCKRYVN